MTMQLVIWAPDLNMEDVGLLDGNVILMIEGSGAGGLPIVGSGGNIRIGRPNYIFSQWKGAHPQRLMIS